MRIPRLAATLVVLGLLVGGCGGSDPGTPPHPRATSLAGLDSASMRLVRVEFCDLVPGSAVRKALGGPSTGQQHWGNGDQPPVEAGQGDLAHEFGCSWDRDGLAARAWIFARPVSAGFVRSVIAQARSRKGCATRTPTRFGTPSLTQTCTTGARTRVRHAGLFGDTWLTCEVVGPVSGTTARAEGWCVAVANALDKS
jgi:hypothetical protein